MRRHLSVQHLLAVPIALAGVLLLGSGARPEAQPAPVPLDPVAGKPRVIVLTDISNEPDDEQSLVRFLLYTNTWDVEGLIATTSVHLRDRVRDDLIRETVKTYGQVRDNLLLHADGYPPVETLLQVVRAGRPELGMSGVGDGKASDGSRHIIEVVDRADERPVWVTVWGGPNTLAQALWDVRRTRSAGELERFVSKLRVYTISDQDDSGPWLRREFPALFYIVSPSTINADEYYRATWSGIGGDRFYRNGPMEHFALVDNPWLVANIIEGHGPLGARYPKVAYIMEGDTPSFLNLVANGLAAHARPDYGGWGGRYALRQSYGESRPIWTNSRDSVVLSDGTTRTSYQATIWRWREAYQHDFAARMDWTVRARDEANHNPAVVVNGVPGIEPVEIAAAPGQVVVLDAGGTSDPDGDTLTYRWFDYPEAGTSARDPRPPIPIDGDTTPRARLTVPVLKRPADVHVILEVRDDGEPNLFSYRRVIVRVAR